MKKIILIAILALAVVNFTACSEGDAHFKDATQLITIIGCKDASVIVIPDDYTSMQSGDVLVKDTSLTVVSVYHTVTGNKKICVENGSAHLIRN